MGTQAQKCLLPVDGVPILGHLMRTFSWADLFITIVGFKAEDVLRCCQRMGVDYFPIFQDEPKGVGDAIMRAQNVIWDEPFWLCWGDHLVEGDFEDVDCNTVWCAEHEDPGRFGVVEVVGDQVLSIEEKPEYPKSNLVCCGVYYIHDAEMFWEELEKDRNFEAALDRLARRRMLWWRRMGSWVDLGTQEQYVAYQESCAASPLSTGC